MIGMISVKTSLTSILHLHFLYLELQNQSPFATHAFFDSLHYEKEKEKYERKGLKSITNIWCETLVSKGLSLMYVIFFVLLSLFLKL